jgi:ribosomal protein L37E
VRRPVSETVHPGGRRPAEGARHSEGPIDVRDQQECEACGTKMYGLHCKIVCPNCGYKRDCSDP